MIRRLTILLLIVGCAHKPPSAQFYIGMTEEEFIKENKGLNIKRGATSKIIGQVLNSNYYIITSDRNRSIFRFYFDFYNDTLSAVYHGTFNYIFSAKEIDYSKYATPPE